jgi:glutathione S-transferase
MKRRMVEPPAPFRSFTGTAPVPSFAGYARRRPRAARKCFGLAGAYSIADMAIWPWASRFAHQKIDLTAYPNVARWSMAVAARPAVSRRYRVVDATQSIPEKCENGAAA